MRWGSGNTYKHAFVGIKAARVVQYLKESYSLTVHRAWYWFQGGNNKFHKNPHFHIIHFLDVFSFGADVINAMASEIVFFGMDKIGRMTLMDPCRTVKTFKVNGKDQIGFYNKVRKYNISSSSLFTSRAAARSYRGVGSSFSSAADFCFLAMVSSFNLLSGIV